MTLRDFLYMHVTPKPLENVFLCAESMQIMFSAKIHIFMIFFLLLLIEIK